MSTQFSRKLNLRKNINFVSTIIGTSHKIRMYCRMQYELQKEDSQQDAKPLRKSPKLELNPDS